MQGRENGGVGGIRNGGGGDEEKGGRFERW